MLEKKIIGENVLVSSPKISYELLILLLTGYFISSELFLLIAFFYLICLIFIRHRGYMIMNSGTHIIYLGLILSIGIVFGLIHSDNYDARDVIRDIFYILNPIIFVLVGVYITKKWRKKYDIYKTIIILSVILSSIKFLSILINVQLLNNIGTAGAIRSELGFVDITVVLGLVLLLTESQRNIKYFDKINVKFLFIIICTIPLILSFSRVNLISLLILFVIIGSDKSKKSIISILFTFMGLALIVGIINKLVPTMIISDFLTKLMRSFTESSSNSDWSNVSNIVNNWRGFEISNAKKVFFDGNINTMFFGYGFGKNIFVGRYAYLVNPQANSTIPVLHNGYYTMLIKNGILGLTFYLGFYIINIKNAIKLLINKKNVYESKVFIGILLTLLVAAYFVTGIVSKNSQPTMCILIGYIGSKTRYENYNYGPIIFRKNSYLNNQLAIDDKSLTA